MKENHYLVNGVEIMKLPLTANKTYCYIHYKNKQYGFFLEKAILTGEDKAEHYTREVIAGTKIIKPAISKAVYGGLSVYLLGDLPKYEIYGYISHEFEVPLNLLFPIFELSNSLVNCVLWDAKEEVFKLSTYSAYEVHTLQHSNILKTLLNSTCKKKLDARLKGINTMVVGNIDNYQYSQIANLFGDTENYGDNFNLLGSEDGTLVKIEEVKNYEKCGDYIVKTLANLSIVPALSLRLTRKIFDSKYKTYEFIGFHNIQVFAGFLIEIGVREYQLERIHINLVSVTKISQLAFLLEAIYNLLSLNESLNISILESQLEELKKRFNGITNNSNNGVSSKHLRFIIIPDNEVQDRLSYIYVYNKTGKEQVIEW